MWAIIKKEVKTYFLSPIAYVFIGLFLGMASLFFYLDVINYGSLQFENMFYSLSTVLTFIIPILTMRMFSEERKIGTETLLYTSPISTTSMVLGKLTASIFVIGICEICTLMYLILLSFLGAIYLPTIGITLLGFFLLSIAYLSFGMFASSLTENQIIAGIITIAFFIMTWFLPNFSEIFMPLSLINLFNKFPSGLISLTEIFHYISFSIVFIILTIIILQKRKQANKQNMAIIFMVIILFLLFFASNLTLQKIDLPDIDLTKAKLFTLSDTSKQKIQDIQTDVTIYLVGFGEESSLKDLTKQYTKTNNHIQVETIEDINQRIDLKENYKITDEMQCLLIQTKEQNQKIELEDLYTYDYVSNEQTDISEEKITNAIINVTKTDKTHLYFLTGHNEYNLEKEQTLLKRYLQNEGYDIHTLDLIVSKEVPKQADLIIIQSPQKDFLEEETKALTSYAEQGGKLLYLTDPLFTNNPLPNLQKWLNEFGITIENGIILEQNIDKMALQSPNYVIPNLATTNATKDIARDGGILLVNATKIRLLTDEELENRNITPTIVVTTSNQALFRTDIENTENGKIESDEEGKFILGVKLEKKLTKEENTKTATLYAISNNFFVADYPITIQNTQVSPIEFYNNKDYFLNTVAELTKTEEGISLRKNIGAVQYTVTPIQHHIIRSIIVLYPISILALGIVIWLLRKKKK